MNDFNPDFPSDLLIEYLEHGPQNGLQRFQTYTIYRFFCALAKKLSPSGKELPALAQMLCTLSDYELNEKNNYVSYIAKKNDLALKFNYFK